MKIKLFVCLFISLFIISLFSTADVLRFYGKEIIVTASRIPQELGRSPWSVTVIKEGEAKTLGAETVADVLRFVPGVDVYSTGGEGALNAVRIKGSNSAQLLVLIDGCRINSPLLGSVDLGDIFLADVERIEVVSSSLSSVYGSDAISGVINVITKKNAKKSPLNVSLVSGSYNKQEGTLSFGTGDLIFTIVYDKTDGFRDNNDYLGKKYSFNSLFETDFGNFSLGASHYLADKGLPGVPDDPAQPTTSSTPDDRQKDDNLSVYLNYDKEFGNSNLSAKMYRYTTDQWTHTFDFINSGFIDSTFKTSQLGVNLQNDITFKKDNVLTFGLECREENGESSFIGNRKITNIGGYANAEIKQGLATLSVGIRGDKHSIAGDSINPRVGVALKPSEDLKLWGNVSTAFKSPTLNDLYWNDPVWLMYGDADLKPEKSVAAELGVNKYFGKGSVLGLSLFARQVNDLILWVLDPTTFITKAMNIARVETIGLEAKYSVQIIKDLDFFTNATFQNPIDREDVSAQYEGKDVPYSPRTKANAGLIWKTYLGEFALLAKHVGERYANAANTIKLEPYTVTDVTYSIEIDQFEIFAKAKNIFDTTYSEAVSWHPITYAIMNYPMPGRNYAFGVGWKM